MSDFRYRAYISYAHADEAWAAWLQHALEAYRVPGRLHSAHPDRPLPKRLAPIFRDREDLSSASDLTESLKQALEQSEAMILVCSPAAAMSRWVNEEVRYFQSLGRADRILCMIVDGDPTELSGADACYPSALFDGVQDAEREPLAADPRDFADGKQLAKLKLAAGLLEVRLDELRQRDLKRRRRLQAVAVLAVIVALALVGNAWRSSIAERHEREKAEQMAAFVVQLGEDLGTALDLQSRSRISTRMLEFYEDLDPEKLSPESRIGVGKALREAARIAEEQGRSEEALRTYTRSRDLFRTMHEQLPDSTEAFFELGQAEFYISNYHYQRGAVEEGISNMELYAEVSRALYESDPEDEQWLLELAYALNGVFALKLHSGRPLGRDILSEGQEALEAADLARRAMPDSAEALANYSNTLAWVADASLRACELPKALESRRVTLELARQASSADPMNNDYRESVAYAHSGVASVEADLGNLDAAIEHLEAATLILERLWSRDPSNERLRREFFDRYQTLVRYHMYRGDEQAALEGLARLEAELAQEEVSSAQREMQLLYRMDYLTTRVLWHLYREESMHVRALLDEMNGYLADAGWGQEPNEDEYAFLARIRYLQWLTNGQRRVDEALPSALPRNQGSAAIRSCNAAMADAWLAIVAGDREAVMEAVNWLSHRRFQAPLFLDFIRRHDIQHNTSG